MTLNSQIIDTAEFNNENQLPMLGDNPNLLLFMTLHLDLIPPCLLLPLYGNSTGGCLLIPTNLHPSLLPPLPLYPIFVLYPEKINQNPSHLFDLFLYLRM